MTELESETSAVSGSADSGVTRLDPPPLDLASTYDLYVVVSDGEGVSATAKRTHDP